MTPHIPPMTIAGIDIYISGMQVVEISRRLINPTINPRINAIGTISSKGGVDVLFVFIIIIQNLWM